MYFPSAQLLLVSPFAIRATHIKPHVAANPDDGKKVPEPDRQVCRIPCAHAPTHAEHEPGKARRKTRPDFPAGPKIRKGHEPDWRQPPPTYLADSESAGVVLF